MLIPNVAKDLLFPTSLTCSYFTLKYLFLIYIQFCVNCWDLLNKKKKSESNLCRIFPSAIIASYCKSSYFIVLYMMWPYDYWPYDFPTCWFTFVFDICCVSHFLTLLTWIWLALIRWRHSINMYDTNYELKVWCVVLGVLNFEYFSNTWVLYLYLICLMWYFAF